MLPEGERHDRKGWRSKELSYPSSRCLEILKVKKKKELLPSLGKEKKKRGSSAAEEKVRAVAGGKKAADKEGLLRPRESGGKNT